MAAFRRKVLSHYTPGAGDQWWLGLQCGDTVVYRGRRPPKTVWCYKCHERQNIKDADDLRRLREEKEAASS
jgi:hypothetical protein